MEDGGRDEDGRIRRTKRTLEMAIKLFYGDITSDDHHRSNEQ